MGDGQKSSAKITKQGFSKPTVYLSEPWFGEKKKSKFFQYHFTK
jgi:hypothetical protein